MLFASVSFRLALNYGLFAILTMLVLISVFYVKTVGVLRQGNIRQITAVTQRLVLIYERDGSTALAIAIDRAVFDGVDSETELYLLLDPIGRPLAGNLEAVPSITLTSRTLAVETPVTRRQGTTRGQLQITPLSDGSRLIVGREMSDQQGFTDLVREATIAAAAITLLLVIGAAVLFRDALERRVEQIRLTTRRVGTGDLKQRIPTTGEKDEFARLDDDINQMLDRIEALMDGVRHVSNTIAHELRTPLTRILSRLQAADRDDVDLATLRRANADAMADVQALTTVFNKLLQIAEAESGTRRRQFASIPLEPIIADVLDLYGALAEDRGLELRAMPVAASPVLGPAVVHGDRDLIGGAIANLVDNALKYAGPGATIDVGLEVRDQAVVITVADNGPGVPESATARLGERFYRVDDAVAPGFGLGLTTVRAIATLHGGQLRFENGRPGLIARLTLPTA